MTTTSSQPIPIQPDYAAFVAKLSAQVQAMVEESGRPAGFNAVEWVARWLEQPLPALGGRRPAELMETPDGQALISSLVARFQSGGYA